MNSAEILQDARRLVEERRARLQAATGKKLMPVTAGNTPLPDADRKHLLDEALDLYWNELEWENLTEEEELEGGPLPELTFPGFLALVRGLLLEKALPSAGVEAQPRPEVVESIAEFLAGRVVSADLTLANNESDDPDLTRAERSMTSQLIDVVLQYLHGIDPGDL